MKYSITINPSSKKSSAMTHAYSFIQAILEQKHEILSVFFYGYAVESLFFKNTWKDIANQVPLFTCSTIADEFLVNGLKPPKHIKIVGLGHWMESVIDADKRVEFV